MTGALRELGGMTLARATGHRLDPVVFVMAGTTVQDDGQVPAAFTAALADLADLPGLLVAAGLAGTGQSRA